MLPVLSSCFSFLGVGKAPYCYFSNALTTDVPVTASYCDLVYLESALLKELCSLLVWESCLQASNMPFLS